MGATRFNRKLLNGMNWSWLEAGKPEADEAVILIHGLALSHNHWRSVMPSLGKNYFVVAPDIPGLNLNTLWPDPEDGFSGMAKHLVNFLTHFNLRKIHLVGHSMGATLAVSAALKDALPLSSLTVVSLADLKMNRHTNINGFFKSYYDFIWSLSYTTYVEYIKSMFFKPPPAVELIAKRTWGDFQSNKRYILNVVKRLESEVDIVGQLLKKIQLPVLVINGTEDQWTDLTELLPYFDQMNVTRVNMKECRHVPFLEHPILFSEELTNFLKLLTTDYAFQLDHN